MPEPLNTTLLSVVVAEVARSGITGLLERARSQPGNIVDLVTGAQPTTLVSVRFSVTMAFSKPYWLLFGLQRAEGLPDMIPVIYGERIKLRVPRARYDLSALFMTKPASFEDRPLLVAVGSRHEVLAFAKGREVTVQGSPPSSDQIERLKAKTPVGQLPFRLPDAKAILPLAAAVETMWPEQRKGLVDEYIADEYIKLGKTFDRPEPELAAGPASGAPDDQAVPATLAPRGLAQPRRPGRLEYSAPSEDGTGKAERRPGSAGQGSAAGGRVGRNDLCPCGSGRKYKRCHGDPRTRQDA